ncbi:MAG: helix-turn-helix domain-containing protein [Candidatus Obscuribacterales bacterium]|nr:helix-turn-helix domain-containing protein [Candidatus Obscuribacterales bacterium]
MYTDEIICQKLTRIAETLERIELIVSSCAKLPGEKPREPYPLVNEKQAAEMMGLSISWFRQIRVTGGGPPFIKVGNAVRYKVSDLESWLDNRRIHHTTEWSEKQR